MAFAGQGAQKTEVLGDCADCSRLIGSALGIVRAAELPM
jgi:hypothetical protein